MTVSNVVAFVLAFVMAGFATHVMKALGLL